MTGKVSAACLLGLAAERCRAARRRQGKTDAEIAKFSKLFTEVQQQIDSKQLRPMIRTQYLRTAFQARPGAPAALTRSPLPPPPACGALPRHANALRVAMHLCQAPWLHVHACIVSHA